MKAILILVVLIIYLITKALFNSHYKQNLYKEEIDHIDD